MDQEISTEVKVQLISQEHQLWANTRELWTIRYRVFQRIDDKQGMEQAKKELEKCEKALDEMDKIFSEMQVVKKE